MQEPARTVSDALNDLGVAIADNLALAIPTLIGVVGVPFVVAWAKRRTKRMTDNIEDWSVEAEQVIGRKKGPEKHAHVKELAKATYPMARHSTIDAIIKGPGTEAANVYRASLHPKDPESS